jgi:hypothetical protein
MLAINFNLSLANILKIKKINSSSLLYNNTLNNNVWNKYNDCYYINTLLLSLLNDYLKAFL